jgi:hypothetical protein
MAHGLWLQRRHASDDRSCIDDRVAATAELGPWPESLSRPRVMGELAGVSGFPQAGSDCVSLARLEEIEPATVADRCPRR